MRLVLDWEWTVTETDSLWMASEEFGDKSPLQEPVLVAAA
jgi:hypothetical protein